MTPAKGKFKTGEVYVTFSRVRTLEKLHIINYTQSQIHMSEHVEKEMKRLRKNILPQIPSHLFRDVPGGLKLLHINIENFKRKIEDIENDDIFQNVDIISFNETHLIHSTLTPHMMGVSKDMFIAHCYHNNRGGGGCSDCKHKSKSKTDQNEYNFGYCVVEISEPIQMIVISVYRPSSTPIDVFMNHMLEIIAQFQHVPTCIVGDFNEDISITSNTHCCTMFRLQCFKQMVNKPTHDGGTIIDHVYVL